MSAEIADLVRRIANLVRVGRVTQVDYTNVRVKMQFGANESAWVPWMTGRAGATKDWNPPAIGEQVAMLSPSGTLGAGFILAGAINWNDRPAPGSDGDNTHLLFADGGTINYNAASSECAVTVPAAGKVLLTCGAGQIEATNVRTKLTLGGTSIELTASGISLTAGGKTMTINSGGWNINGPVVQTGGGITTTGGDIVADGKSLKTHVHGGVQSGGSNTGVPI